MEVIFTVLLCVLGLLIYLLNESKNEILQLKDKLHEREFEIAELRRDLRERENKLREVSPAEIQNSAPPVEKRFVQVIFNEDAKKAYDYFLGKNFDVKIGDFVEVYFSDKDNGKSKLTVAKVVYISAPGEKSEYAKSTIKRKTNRHKW